MAVAYKTIEGRSQAEIEEKKSRFIAHVAHVETEEEALAFLDEIRTLHRTARHNVYAYVLRADSRVRYSDDGEPQKTAGLPTLDVINHAELTDIIIVTTRYFGGTLLGTGGLVRAYTQAAQAALEQATVISMSLCMELSIDIPYALYDQTLYLLNEHEVKIVDTQFTNDVHIEALLLKESEEPVAQALQTLLKGCDRYVMSGPVEVLF